ncbi:MAG: coenzyme transferase [Lacrimispora sp.]|jgi:glutaconate CoA-transferase subunit A|nr:coenzyme transferase [Lacrimispora sp.]
MSKMISMQEAAAMVSDGTVLGIGGNVLHRAPMAFVRELVRQRKRNLKLVKTAGAMDVDMLCFGGCVTSVDAGFISYESEFSLAMHYRKAVESGQVKGNEHACYTVISALRAASYGVGFMPVKGLSVSDLIEENDYFTRITDPFTNEMVTVVKAIRPDVAVIHVQEADEDGNARISGPLFEDILLSRAAKRVILTAEHIVSSSLFSSGTKKADIPHFLVSGVVHTVKGAAPCSCAGSYDIDTKGIRAFKEIKDQDGLAVYLSAYERADRRGLGGRNDGKR